MAVLAGVVGLVGCDSEVGAPPGGAEASVATSVVAVDTVLDTVGAEHDTVPTETPVPLTTAVPVTTVAASRATVAPAVDTIAFQSNRTVDGSFEIFSVRVDGSGLIQLTDGRGTAMAPDWSPDGTRIAFDAARDGEADDIYTMNNDGTDVRRLTDDPARDRDPSWSPDGTRIAFVSERDGNREIYVMGADGSNQVRLTDEPEYDDHPDWGPDGRIVFASRRDVGDWDLFLIDPDGSGLTRVTDSSDAEDNYPVWSPDGQWIAFHTNLEGGSQPRAYWVVRPDGSEAHIVAPQVTGSCVNGESPTWSPESGRLAFGALCGTVMPGSTEIHISSLDGSFATTLLPGANLPPNDTGEPFTDDQRPDWSPA